MKAEVTTKPRLFVQIPQFGTSSGLDKRIFLTFIAKITLLEISKVGMDSKN